MSDSQQLPPRPEPSRSLTDTAAAWLAWFGLSRLILAAASVTVVALGVLWLVRAPAAPTEAALPYASATSSADSPSTLPPPTTHPVVVTTTPPPALLVHVAGEVARPGVYELRAGSRVNTAVEAAGGPLPEADLDGLNLAAPLADGQRIYVPAVGEVDPATVASGANGATASVVGEAGADVVTGPIDLNTATAPQLETLPGIGPATATAIIGDRDRNGPFASVDDLERVPGIGPAKMAAIVELVTV